MEFKGRLFPIFYNKITNGSLSGIQQYYGRTITSPILIDSVTKAFSTEEMCVDMISIQNCDMDMEFLGEMPLPQDTLHFHLKQHISNINGNRYSFPSGVSNNFPIGYTSSIL
jgi:hypothetical protein